MRINKTLLRYNHDLSKSQIPTIVSIQYVKNLGYPTCLDCIYFVPSKIDNSPDLGKCAKFAEQDLSSGKINLKSASFMRLIDRDGYCGPNAKYKQTIKGDHLIIVHRIPHSDT